MNKNYLETIVKHYENCLEKHGDNHLGVDWPKQDDVFKRYRIMLEIIILGGDKNNKVSLLDFGCGAAHLYKFITENGLINIDYSGLDVSEKFVKLSRDKYPQLEIFQADILDKDTALPMFDYVIMNGVFTEKRELSFEDMWEYFCKMIDKVFSITKRGIAFNVISKAVDWEREDLFHVSTDLLIGFLTKNITRNFIIRNDYGLYEFTTYLYK